MGKQRQTLRQGPDTREDYQGQVKLIRAITRRAGSNTTWHTRTNLTKQTGNNDLIMLITDVWGLLDLDPGL